MATCEQAPLLSLQGLHALGGVYLMLLTSSLLSDLLADNEIGEQILPW